MVYSRFVKNPFDSFWQNSVPKWHEVFRPNFKSSRFLNKCLLYVPLCAILKHDFKAATVGISLTL